MILITSAQYMSEEFTSEFGKLPPSFLPVGNKRLYEHQAELFIALNETVYISLPDDFEIPHQDLIRLKRLNIKPIFISCDKSLAESIAFALIDTLGEYEKVYILHGDTLFDKLPLSEPNAFATGHSSENYNWASFEKGSNGRISFLPLKNDNVDAEIVSGYFSFDSPVSLLKALSKSNGEFLSALNIYAKEIELCPVVVDSWLDFGHMNTYYRSKSTVTTQRSFNEMNITPRVVRKSSENKFKMLSEIQWFESIPAELKIYTPHYLNQTESRTHFGYDIEYLYLPVLNELFVFGELPLRTWKKILKSCEEFLLTASRHKPTQIPKVNALYNKKLWQRLKSYCEPLKIDMGHTWKYNGKQIPSLQEISNDCLGIIASTPPNFSVVHGDFCFSNILYDFRLQAIRCIDPRGHLEDDITMYGDLRYDLAKLCHSVIGGYDHIIAGNFSWHENAPYNIEFELFNDSAAEKIESYLLDNGLVGMDLIKDGIYSIMITLFLSMLPLHNDKPMRQKAFLANALRLYIKMNEIK